jgi:hypothetical protein
VVLGKASTGFQKRQAAAAALMLLVKIILVESLAMGALVLHLALAAHLSTTQVAVVVVVIDRLGLLEVLEVAVLEGFFPPIQVARLEQQTQAAAGVAQMLLQQRRLAAPVLLSCPTPCQKAKSLNSFLLRHGKHQQASLPLTIWW